MVQRQNFHQCTIMKVMTDWGGAEIIQIKSLAVEEIGTPPRGK